MSREIETEVWRYSRAKAVTKLVLLCVANEANNTNREAFIDVYDIAAQCNVGWRHVYDQLAKLEEMLEVEKIADRTYTVRKYVASGGYLNGKQLNVYEDHAPKPGNIKDPDRQASVRAMRPRQRKRRPT